VVALRYFNVAGAARPELGDPGVFNLIPLAFQALTAGRAPQIFGDDWPTPDGTCIRDYVHVADIADAHVAALEPVGDAPFQVFNIGRGEGSSVRQVLETVRSVTAIDIEPVVVDRRPGDPARIVADVGAIQAAYGWKARFELEDMVRTAWEGWQLRHR
jgi:UDP-glucose 4-epimerase